MIVGTEGIFTWNGGAITLNRRDLPVHYRVSELAGLRALPDFEPTSDKTIGRTGEAPRQGTRNGKTITISGEVVAKTGRAALRQAQADLSAAFATTDEKQLTAKQHPDFAGADPLSDRRFRARCLACDPDEGAVQSPNMSRSGGWEMPFTLTLRLDDPRFYFEDLVTLTDDTASPMGGAGVPFTPGGSSAGPDATGFQITVDNPGNFDSEAILRLHGYQRNPVVSNQTLDVFLRFRDLIIPGGEFVEIDFRRRKVQLNGDTVSNVRHLLDPSSTWWDRGVVCLAPGSNVIRSRAYSVGMGASFDIDYRPADIA